jgi:NAD(P)-dependent dehydrogenase (short-subunit alcohol dehydrogenase family)
VRRVAVVTGANRGIGREVARQLATRGDVVVLGARDPAKGERAAAELARGGAGVLPRHLDVTDPATLERLAAELAERHGRLDVLVNNAAIHYDTWQHAAAADLAVVREALDTNLLGAWRAVQAFLPLLRAAGHGRVVNVSSEAGSLASMGPGAPAYNVSKAGLNALTRMLAADLRRDRILVNAVCPRLGRHRHGRPRRPSRRRRRRRHPVGRRPARRRPQRRLLPRRPPAALVASAGANRQPGVPSAPPCQLRNAADRDRMAWSGISAGSRRPARRMVVRSCSR